MLSFRPFMEGVSWLGKLRVSFSPHKKPSNCNISPPLAPRPKVWPSAHALSSVVRAPTSPGTIRWRRNLAVIPTPSPAGAAASGTGDWTVCTIYRAAADRPLFPPEDRHKVLVLVTTTPADAGTPVSHWSLDDLATRILNDAHFRDMSRSTIQRILAAAELKPHKLRSWMHSDDPEFERLALDICGLYVQAPRLYRQGELIVCTDEKTGIQALQRKHPGKPAAPGLPQLWEPEYIRHGTRCLLATFVVPTGLVCGDVTARRTNQDFRRHIRHVVNWLTERYPQMERVHWVMDNLNTHWSLAVCQLFAQLNGVKFEPKKLKRGPQRRAFLTDPEHCHVVHFTPKHGSWLNQVELWFSVLARRVIRRGNFTSKADLARKIVAYMEYHNVYKAHPYAWTYAGKPLVRGARE
jgi:transposase